MQINETKDLEMKIKSFGKDYHSGSSNEGLTEFWTVKIILIYIYIVTVAQ